MSPRKRRLLFLINSLNPGGAERQLTELVSNLDPSRFETLVVVTYDAAGPGKEGFYRQVAAVPGVTLACLHKRHGALGYARSLPRLFRLVQAFEPDVLHGYMEGNLPVLLTGALLRKPAVWGIRRSSVDHTKMDLLSRALLRLTIALSGFADLVIFNSEAGLRNHRAMGMKGPRMAVVPNGFSMERFHPDPRAGGAWRRSQGIPEGVPLLGIVGRLDPVKDHPTFLRAAARVIRQCPDAHFVCAGGGPGPYLEALQAQAGSLGLGERVHWPGTCSDMGNVYNALSALLLTSTDEGFPNVLGEAMACGVPCVTTRVGDAALLVGGTGYVCEVGDDGAIAAAVLALLGEEPPAKADRSSDARARIRDHFSVQALARNTEALLEGVVAGLG
ncbi:glycosyltransferase [Mesoterricola silvestris]|uniref:Glycosyl transferase n=1 Tax=Mesoterricola silvestris TaxID=2927979 RepID=A0AA48K856_9BACT|nr:glycosyltransferase [Mesoterricola silvestris]BDU71780.1 glycosyl transferase [Mesoterricola silvestris]